MTILSCLGILDNFDQISVVTSTSLRQISNPEAQSLIDTDLGREEPEGNHGQPHPSPIPEARLGFALHGR